MKRTWKQVLVLAIVGVCSLAVVSDAFARPRLFGRRRARTNTTYTTTTTATTTVRGQTPEAARTGTGAAVTPANPTPPPNLP